MMGFPRPTSRQYSSVAPAGMRICRAVGTGVLSSGPAMAELDDVVYTGTRKGKSSAVLVPAKQSHLFTGLARLRHPGLGLLRPPISWHTCLPTFRQQVQRGAANSRKA